MKNTRSVFLSSLTALSLMALTTAAYADVIYSNFGAGDTYSLTVNYPVYGPNTGISTDSQSEAAFFTPTQNFTLTSFEVGVRHLLGPNSFLFSIVADNGGLPTGAAIVSPFNTSLTGTMATPAIDSFSVTGSLLAGQKYWLVMEPGTPESLAWWGANTTGAMGVAIQSNGDPWILDGGRLPSPVFRINGRPTVPTNLTPEMPAGVQAVPILLAVGGMALYQRRKRSV
ncbi:MAG: choice-of-anchor R domain-containing protein [Armatimonas sp.]